MRTTARPWRRLAAAVAAVVSLTALAGCSSAVQEARGGGSDAKASDGGTLKIGVATDLQTATPFSNASDATNVLIGLVYDSLVDLPHESLKPKPALATSWKTAPDGKSVTLQLRKGVKFHTGRELTSKDVEFSIKQWADPTFAVQFQRTAAAVTGFDTSDPHAITLKFDHPLSNIFDLLDVLPIIDSATIDQLKAGKEYIGTGPFTFDKWTPGSQLTFSRNDDYWRGAPHLDGVQAKVVGDSQSQVSQLRSGQLDAIIGAGNRDLESLKKGGQFDVTRFTGAEQQVYVGANVANPELKDKRLRQAIAYGVDRPRIVKDVYRGAGYPINLPWPTYSPAYDAKANHTYDRDVAKAKKLVAAASAGGSRPTIPLEFDANSGNIEATAQIVQSNLEDIGIKVELQPGRPQPVHQGAHRGQVQGPLDPEPLLRAVDALDARGQRLPVQRRPQRLALRLDELPGARQRCLGAHERHGRAGQAGLREAQQGPARQPVPDRARDHLHPGRHLAEGPRHRLVEAAGDPPRERVPVVTRYLLRRIPSALLILFLASVLIFLVIRLVPGDPVATLAGPDATPEARAAIRLRPRARPAGAGAVRPVALAVLHGRPRPVVPDRRRHRLDSSARGWSTRVVLTLTALLFAVVIGMTLSVVSVVADRRWLDALLAGVNTLAVALPTFVTGLLLILVLSRCWCRCCPPAGCRRTGSWPGRTSRSQYLLLPALCLALPAAAALTRFLTDGLQTAAAASRTS